MSAEQTRAEQIAALTADLYAGYGNPTDPDDHLPDHCRMLAERVLATPWYAALAAALPDPEQAVREALDAVLREFMVTLPATGEAPDYIAPLTAAMLKVREARSA